MYAVNGLPEEDRELTGLLSSGRPYLLRFSLCFFIGLMLEMLFYSKTAFLFWLG